MTGCTADRHGDALAYMVDACRCPDARESYRIYRKRLREGRHQPAYTPSCGPARKLRALAVLGHGLPALAAALGMGKNDVYKIRAAYYPTIQPGKATRIDMLYARLIARPPGPSTKATARTTAHALRQGWAPPWAWNDPDVFDINDPDADEQLAARTAGMHPTLRATVRDETRAAAAAAAARAATATQVLDRYRHLRHRRAGAA